MNVVCMNDVFSETQVVNMTGMRAAMARMTTSEGIGAKRLQRVAATCDDKRPGWNTSTKVKKKYERVMLDVDSEEHRGQVEGSTSPRRSTSPQKKSSQKESKSPTIVYKKKTGKMLDDAAREAARELIERAYEAALKMESGRLDFGDDEEKELSDEKQDQVMETPMHIEELEHAMEKKNLTIEKTDVLATFAESRESNDFLKSKLDSLIEENQKLRMTQRQRLVEFLDSTMDTTGSEVAKLKHELSSKLSHLELEKQTRLVAINDFQSKVARKIHYLHRLSNDIAERERVVTAAFNEYENSLQTEYQNRIDGVLQKQKDTNIV